MPSYGKVIHWFRRDLRLSDNTALFQATESAQEVVPVYITSTWKSQHGWTGAPRQQFLCGCLESLGKNLEAIGSRLVVRSGEAVAELEKLIRETEAEAVFLNRDPDPFGKGVEKQLQQKCRELGVAFHGYKDVVLHEQDEVLNGSGLPYRVYTPYSKNWFTQDKPTPLPRVKSLGKPSEITSEPLPSLETWGLASNPADILPAGERAANERLIAALEGPLLSYAENRNDPTSQTTSLLGGDLRFGTLSPRQVFAQSQAAMSSAGKASQRQSIFTFQKQLAWREFFMAILGHFPEVLDTDFNEKWRGLHWDDPEEENKFETWKQGMTGFPIVDAGMRQLLATGYMHNRVRMIVAMFLTKDLHLHWRLGESHFMQWLVDGEIANNNGGWQWSAGTGADAAPYFRIQNPWTQTARFDPRGEYIKQWVPELAEVNPKRFQSPAEPLDPLAQDYPLPMVDHKTERERTLEIFAKHKQTLEA